MSSLYDDSWKEFPCKEWQGPQTPKGYGITSRIDGNIYGTRRAHRVTWFKEIGNIPDNLHVLHKCDNPPCVEISHLFLGTNKDNITDKQEKGRGAPGNPNFGELCREIVKSKVGEKHHRASLTQEQAERIRELYGPKRNSRGRTPKEFHSATQLAEMFGVSQATILNVINKDRYA